MLSYPLPAALTCQPTRFLLRNNRSEMNNAFFNGYLNTAQRENSTSQYLAGEELQAVRCWVEFGPNCSEVCG